MYFCSPFTGLKGGRTGWRQCDICVRHTLLVTTTDAKMASLNQLFDLEGFFAANPIGSALTYISAFWHFAYGQ